MLSESCCKLSNVLLLISSSKFDQQEAELSQLRSKVNKLAKKLENADDEVREQFSSFVSAATTAVTETVECLANTKVRKLQMWFYDAARTDNSKFL